MKFRKLGNTDINLSVIGLGTWAIGGGGYKYGWGKQDDQDSIATIHRALDLGINWIDTAPVYGDGHSEEIVGIAIKGKRDKIIISTKCGLFSDENKEELIVNLKKESIRKEIESSLKRLQIDYIDIYQLHETATTEIENEDAWRVLEELIKEGKIRYAGVSNFTGAQIKRVHAIHPVSFTQPEYSMLEPSIENGLMDYCSAKKIGIIAYSPMFRGMLTGELTKERVEKLPSDDNRLTLDYYKEPFLSANLQLVEKLRVIAAKSNHTPSQLAIAWVLRRPEITAAIVGARKPYQIEQTSPAGDWTLSIEENHEIEKVLKEHYSLLSKFKGETINYLDKKLQLSFAPDFSPESDMVPLDIYGSADKDGLNLLFNYNKYQFDKVSMIRFVDRYKQNLSNIIKHCVDKKKEIVKQGKTANEYHINQEYESYLKQIEMDELHNLSEKMEYKNIMVTGGTGFLGSHLVADLLKNTNANLYLPVRASTQDMAQTRFMKKMIFYFGENFYSLYKDRIQVLCSELSEANLGIESSKYNEISRIIDTIVHPAANVKHYGTYEELYKDNVIATEQLLKLAVTEKKKDFHYVSTISVGEGNVPGKDTLLFTEYSVPKKLGMEINHIYLRSKAEGEAKVLEFRKKGINTSIYRVGNLIFHSETGKFQENIGDDYFYNIIKGSIKLKMVTEWMMKNMIFDMSFINYTSKAIGLLMRLKNLKNQIFHVLNPNTFPMTEMSKILRELGFVFNYVDTEQEKKYLMQFENNAEYEKIIELLKIHSWVFEEKQGTQSVFKMDRTLKILENLDFVWLKTDRNLIEKMIMYCKEVGFI